MLYDLIGVTKRYTQGRKTVDALAGIDLQIADGIFGDPGVPRAPARRRCCRCSALSTGPAAVRWSMRAATWPSWGRATCGLRSHSYGFVFQSFNLIPTLTAQENVQTAPCPGT